MTEQEIETVRALTDDEREEIASVLCDWYWCFVRAGFEEHQAMQLVRGMLTDGL